MSFIADRVVMDGLTFDGTDVDMLQRAVKFFLFSHWKCPPLIKTYW